MIMARILVRLMPSFWRFTAVLLLLAAGLILPEAASAESPSVSLSATSLAFPDEAQGVISAVQIVTLRNIGTAVLNISSVALAGSNPTSFWLGTSCGATVYPNTSCEIRVRFVPVSNGQFSAAVAIADDAVGSPQSISLSGRGHYPIVSLSASNLTFADEPVGVESPAQTVTLTNTGGAVLNISSVALTGPESTFYLLERSCGATVYPNTSCEIRVSLLPLAATGAIARVAITDDASNTPQAIDLLGRGHDPVVSLSTTLLDFPNQTVGVETAAQVVMLTNTGDAALNLTGIAPGGAYPSAFPMTTTCGTMIYPAASCAISVKFVPEINGTLTASITVRDNAPGGPQVITLEGTALYNPSGPIFLPGSGNYAGPLSVTISAPQGSSIYYTTDGETPTSSSALYTSPIVLTSNVTLSAVAIAADHTASPQTNSSYNISPVVATVNAFAGTGVQGDTGDNGPAVNAELNAPGGLFADPAGNVYIADVLDERVRAVSPFGVINTVAGDGVWGTAGEGGQATAAELESPAQAVSDPAGNLYLSSGNTIQKVDTAGVITAYAGNGISGFSGDGGPAIDAELAIPSGVAVDRFGNLFIADTGNNRIRKVTPDGNISTFAGGGQSDGDSGLAIDAALCAPESVAVDGAGTVYFSDMCKVRKVTAAGIISRVAGTGVHGHSGDGGPATQATFLNLAGVAVDQGGNVYVDDLGQCEVFKITPNGTINSLVGYVGDDPNGCPAVTNALTSWLAVDNKANLYISVPFNHQVLKVTFATPQP